MRHTYCITCGAQYTGRSKYCSDTCREQRHQEHYDEAIQAGVLEEQARQEILEIDTSYFSKTNQKNIKRRASIDEKLDTES